MKRKNRQWLDIAELILSVLLIVTALVLLLYWKKEPVLFCIVFGLAAILLAVLGIDVVIGKKRKIRLGAAVAYFISATAMIGFLTASILVVVKG